MRYPVSDFVGLAGTAPQNQFPAPPVPFLPGAACAYLGSGPGRLSPGRRRARYRRVSAAIRSPLADLPRYTRRIMKRFLLALVLACALSAPAWAGFDEGLAAAKRGDYETALWEWRPLAERGDADAQLKLGNTYVAGHAEPVNWNRRAAEQGLAKAQTNLGFMYRTGQGVAQDYAEAVKWYRRAAEQGIAEAQHNLGFMYHEGQGMAQDYAEAVKWYRRAAEQGLAEAQTNLGYMYHTGRGVAQDYVQAHLWHNLAVLRMPPGETRDIAVRNRDRAEKLMTSAQVSEAQRLAREWKPKVEAEN